MNIVKNIIRRTTVIALLALAAASCSVTQKTLRTEDPQKIYELALQEYTNERWTKARELFDYVEPYFSNSGRDDSLKFMRARCVFKDGDYEYALSLFEDYRRRYSHSRLIEDAEGMYTLSHYYRAPGSKRDPSLTQTALSAIDEFLSRYPFSEKRSQFSLMRADLMERLYDKAFLNAYTYYKIGYYKSAIIAFKNANLKYPESIYREKISYYIVASAYELADNSVITKKEDRFLQMMDNYYTFIAEFPESEFRKSADNMMEKARQYVDKMNKEREKKEAAEGQESGETTEEAIATAPPAQGQGGRPAK